jgi:hypothetical protein
MDGPLPPPPCPKDEEAETGKLDLEHGTTDTDSSANQRVAKKMAASEIDEEQ